jgi:hypothetical protein
MREDERLTGRGGKHDDIAEPRLGGDELADNDADGRHAAAAFFKPDDRFVGARLQQMYGAN